MALKALISSRNFGDGKSWLGMSFSQYVDHDVLSLDYEDRQEFTVKSRDKVDPGQGRFYVYRLRCPTIYELMAIEALLKNPKGSSTSLMVGGRRLDPEAVRQPTIDLMTAIHKGELNIGTVFLDTITRVCELEERRTFEAVNDLDKAERMSRLLWAKAKDAVADIIWPLVEADINIIMSAWSKNEFDKATMKNTNEIIADVLKNVNAFVSLSLMLETDPKRKGPKKWPASAVVLKSSIPGLVIGDDLPVATWPEILKRCPEDYDVPGLLRDQLAPQA